MAASDDIRSRAMFGVECEYAGSFWTGRRRRMPQDLAMTLLRDQMRTNPSMLGPDPTGGFFLANGGRFYIDAGWHPEYCTPEVTNPWDAVRYVAAGNRMLARAAATLAAERANVSRWLITRCNVDYSGNATTWGQHESYLSRVPLDRIATGLVPHLSTRIVYTGAGGFDNRKRGMHFVLSPRAMHVVAVYSACTTEARGIVNLRDEPLVREPWRRVHLTYGEALCSQLALFLKVGTTALVVRALEHDPNAFASLALAAPVAATTAIALDPAVVTACALEDGRRMTAIEIQRALTEVIEQQAGQGDFPVWTTEVLAIWRQTLDDLARDPRRLAGKLDWATKYSIYRDRQDREGFHPETIERCNRMHALVNEPAARESLAAAEEAAEADPSLPGRSSGWYACSKAALARSLQFRALAHAGLDADTFRRSIALRDALCEIDTRYGAVGADGIHESLTRDGAMRDRMVSDAEIEAAILVPPTDTRAKRRGDAVAEMAASPEPACCNWDRVLHGRKRLDLADPFATEVDWICDDERNRRDILLSDAPPTPA